MYNHDCRDCKLGDREMDFRCVPARMQDHGEIKDVRVLLVGEAPSPDDMVHRQPFMGADGGLLTKALKILANETDLDLSRLALTYAVKCPPLSKNPPVAAKRACLQYFDAELEKYQPGAIVALGGQTIGALTDGEISAVGPNRLKVLEYRGLPLMVTFHPAAVLYDRTKAQDLLDDLYAYLVEEIWDKEEEEQKFQVRLVNTPEGFEAVARLLADEAVVGLDIETDGFTPNVLTIALSVGDVAYVLPVHHFESNLNGQEVIKWVVTRFIRRKDKVLVGQNIKYDLSMLMRAHGIGHLPVLCKTADSMLYHYMLNEHSTARNLDYLSRAYTGLGGYKEEVDHGNLAAEELTTLARYNGRDAATPAIIIEKIQSQLIAEGYRSEAMERFYSRLTPFVATMEGAGIKVDRVRLGEVREDLEQSIDELREAVEEMAPDVNLDSPQQLSKHLYETLALEIPDVKDSITPAGQPSTREDVISHLNHPFVDALLEYRGTAKLLRTYVRGIEDNLWPNSFVHPQFFIAKTDFGGTVTGRLSCKRPALQTIPRGSDIRSVFRPRREGGLLLEVDASQAELRVASAFSRDPRLMAMFRSGDDPHQITADLCGVDRQVGKTINFASIYGVTWYGLVEKAGLAESLARRVAKTIKKEWAGLYAYFDEIKKTAVRTGEVSTAYGRWRRVPGAEPTTPRGRMLLREAANFVIQAPASDFVQTLGSSLTHALEGDAVPIMSNHDGLYFDVFDGDRIQYVVDTILTELENFSTLINTVFEVDLGVPFEWDMKVGPNLKEMNEWE